MSFFCCEIRSAETPPLPVVMDANASDGTGNPSNHRNVTSSMPKIKLRVNVPDRDDALDEEDFNRQVGRRAERGALDEHRGPVRSRSTVRDPESRSMSELGASMSLGEECDGEEVGTGAHGGSFASPTMTKRRGERACGARSGPTSSTTSGGDGTPMSIERTASPASKRARIGDDWVEDEVHPSKVWGTPGSGGRMMSEVMASSMWRSLSVDEHQSSYAIGDSTWASTSMSTSPSMNGSERSLLKRTLSGTYSNHPAVGMDASMLPPGGLPGGVVSGGSGGGSGGGGACIAKSPTGESAMTFNYGKANGVNGGGASELFHGSLPPSSPSDPSPLHDLRKAALMRSRLLKASSSASLPPRSPIATATDPHVPVRVENGLDKNCGSATRL